MEFTVCNDATDSCGMHASPWCSQFIHITDARYRANHKFNNKLVRACSGVGKQRWYTWWDLGASTHKKVRFYSKLYSQCILYTQRLRLHWRNITLLRWARTRIHRIKRVHEPTVRSIRDITVSLSVCTHATRSAPEQSKHIERCVKQICNSCYFKTTGLSVTRRTTDMTFFYTHELHAFCTRNKTM